MVVAHPVDLHQRAADRLDLLRLEPGVDEFLHAPPGETVTAGKGAETRPLARQHTIYCSAGERAELGARADAAGMSFSRYMVACALHEEDRTDGPHLVLGEDEQRELTRRVEVLDRCTHALLKRLPGSELSALGALAFLVRAATEGTRDDGEERR